MADEAGGFAEDQQGVVLVEDVDGGEVGFQARRRFGGQRVVNGGGDEGRMRGCSRLRVDGCPVVSVAVRESWKKAMPWVFLVVFAATRWPGLMPSNFSAAYALMFCAGVFFPRRTAWVASFAVMLATDLTLTLWYQYGSEESLFTSSMFLSMAANYASYAILVALGRCLKPDSRMTSLVGGGVLGALVFYIVTNTASWLFNPFKNAEYTRTLAGWITALTKGTGGYPETWTFFRNTLLGGGLFTAMFAVAWKLSAGESPREKGEEQSSPLPEAEPGEAQA